MEDYHTPYPVKGSFPPIDESNIGKLQVVLQDDEIKAAIFSMHPFKAPGVDGQMAFMRFFTSLNGIRWENQYVTW